MTANIFKTTTWQAYQLWIFKASMFVLGILVGVYFTEVCQNLLPLLWTLGGIGTIVTTYFWWQKITQ